MRKVFLDDLPRKKGIGANKDKDVIDWKNSIEFTINFIYNDVEGEIEIIDYDTKEAKLTIKYNNKKFNIYSSKLLECKLGTIIGEISKEFKVEVGTHFKDDKRDIVIINREYRDRKDCEGKRKWYKYKCNKCGWENGWVEEYNLLKRVSGCSCCHSLTTVLGINTIWDTCRWMCDLGVSEEDAKKYTSNSTKEIKVRCPICGKEKFKRANTIFRNKSIGCKVCSDGISFPEKFIFSLLTQLNLRFEREYSPDYLIMVDESKISRKRSDFYLLDYNIVIETDGGLGHNGGRMHTSSKKSLSESIEIDNWKDEQHLKHGVQTIRINCFQSDMEYIKRNVLNSELSEIFELDRVDWDECNMFAMSNMLKKVCNYWNNRGECDRTTDLAKIFGVSSSTIRSYLKKGTKLGFCVYNGKDEMKINGFLAGEMSKRNACKTV